MPAPVLALPYLTADLPGIGGLIKQHLEDFVVHEVPLYKPDGTGTHCYVRIEKRGITTMEAARLLARALGRKAHDLGFAGLKDARAITSQWFSIEHEYTDRILELPEIPHLKILEITRHRNKIKMGHLAGNRFQINVRNPEWQRAGGGSGVAESRKRAEAIWAVLEKTGTPNFFGPQRFGMRGDNHLLGLDLLNGNYQDFANRFLGDPDESVDHGPVLAARRLYAQGEMEKALASWPGHLAQERRALAAMIKGKNNPKRAVYAIDLRLKNLLISALQSHLFNQVLTQRLPKLAVILPGDLCWKHDNGACFAVGENPDDAMKEQPRADAHAISPSGPLYGYRMTQPTSIVQTMEAAVLAENQLTLDSFRGPQGAQGGRRPLRIFPEDFKVSPGTDDRGPYLQFAFTLPAGSYATVLLGEIMKANITLD